MGYAKTSGGYCDHRDCGRATAKNASDAPLDKAAVIKMIAGNKCEVKDWKLEDPQMAKIDADTYVLATKEHLTETALPRTGSR